MPLSLFAVFTFFAVGGAFFLFSGEAHSETAPAWSLQDVNGKTISLSDYKGQIVILNFWATFCPPCLEEIPNFIDIAKKYQGKGVVVIGISADSVQPPEVAAFARKRGMNYPIVMLTDKVVADYGLDGGIPVTVIVRPDGKIATKWTRTVTEEMLEQYIQKLLPTVTAH